LSRKLHYVGDPVDMEGAVSKEEARARFGIPQDKTVLLVYGALTLRKGIRELLTAAQEPNFPDNVCLLMAGKQDAEVKSLLADAPAQSLSAQHRLYEADAFLSDADELAAFTASEIVWIGYKEFYGMSGVLIQTGKMGLPVVASQEGLIGWLTKKHKLGPVIDATDTQQIIDALTLLYQKKTLAEEYGCNGKRLSQNHTSAAFATRILEICLAN
jgi:glycosyltransferase involved in cell wall biosynthesis